MWWVCFSDQSSFREPSKFLIEEISMETSKIKVGEIDTSAPFQSVRDAVSLFGAVRFMRKKASTKHVEPQSAEENIVAKETRLHLAEKELEKLKEQLQYAEAAKGQALKKLDEAKKSVDDLQDRLLIASKSKDAAVKDAEMSMIRVKQLEPENSGTRNSVASLGDERLQTFRYDYLTATLELVAAKKELTKVRQDYDASLKSNACAMKQALKAEVAAKDNSNIFSELSFKIMVLKESIMLERLATEKAQQERARIFVEKDVQRRAYRASIDVSTRQLRGLLKEFNPELLGSVKLQLKSRLAEIEAVQQEINSAKVSDLASARAVALELGNANEFLEEVIREDNSLQLLVESLKLELVSVKNEVADLTIHEAKLQSLAEDLHVKLGRGKAELEACAAEELTLRSSCDEMSSALSLLSNETESAMQEARTANMEIEVLKKEAEANRILNEKAKVKLRELMQEAEMAKSAEAAALDQIKNLSEQTKSARSLLSSSNAKLKLSKQEYGSLTHKVVESNTLTDIKISAAMAQVEALKGSERENINKLHLAQKELEDLKLATADCMKKAAMSEAARNVLERELCRLREVELKKAAMAASETDFKDHLTSECSPEHQTTHNSIPLEKMLGETWRYGHGGAALSKKALLPKLSSRFQRK